MNVSYTVYAIVRPSEFTKKLDCEGSMLTMRECELNYLDGHQQQSKSNNQCTDPKSTVRQLIQLMSSHTIYKFICTVVNMHVK